MLRGARKLARSRHPTPAPLSGAALPVAPRDARYAALTDADAAAIKTRCSRVVEGADCAPFNVDWMNKWTGRARLVAKPASTAEVAAVLAYCDERRLAVVPQGGNTGLVGGSVPVHDEVVLSTTGLDSIEAFDEDTGVVTCGAGVVLETLDAFLRERGHVAPLDLGASGTGTPRRRPRRAAATASRRRRGGVAAASSRRRVVVATTT